MIQLQKGRLESEVVVSDEGPDLFEPQSIHS